MCNCGVYRCTTVAAQWNICVQCGNHIYSVIYVKYVCSAHCHMVDCITSYLALLYLYIFLYVYQIFGIHAKFGGCICF